MIIPVKLLILFSIDYPALTTIGAKFKSHPITDHNLDIVHSHLASKISKDFTAIIQFHLKLGVWKTFGNYTFYF